MGDANGNDDMPLGDPSLPYMDVEACLSRMKIATGQASDAQLADHLDIAYSTLASWRRRNSVPLRFILTVAREKSASLDWLILGIDRAQLDGRAEPKEGTDLAFSEEAVRYATEIVQTYPNISDTSSNERKNMFVFCCRLAQSQIDMTKKNGGKDPSQVKKAMEIWISQITRTWRGMIA